MQLMLQIFAAGLTTLSFGVATKGTIGQVDAEYEPWEGDFGLDFRDDKYRINPSGGNPEVTVLVGRTHVFVIHRNLQTKVNVRNSPLVP